MAAASDDGNTNTEFQQMQQTQYLSAVIIVSGGSSRWGDTARVEVLSAGGAALCSLPDLPQPRQLHSQTGLTACGGTSTTGGDIPPEKN